MAKINFARPLMEKKHYEYFNLATLVSSALLRIVRDEQARLPPKVIHWLFVALNFMSHCLP